MPESLRDLLSRPTAEVAVALLGWRLACDRGGARTVGRIVETEAYLAIGDDASHSASGPTARNASMFLAPGHAYVYRIYGLHHCVNVSTAAEGTGEAVLLRALEPLEGLDVMRERRGARIADRDLCRGPGRLCEALDIDLSCDGSPLTSAPLLLLPPDGPAPEEVLAGPRVGITRSADLPLRFRVRGSRWTS